MKIRGWLDGYQTFTKRDKFRSPYEDMEHRNGQPFEIIGLIYNEGYEYKNLATQDGELPMFRIQFSDGYVSDAWPEEVIDGEIAWQRLPGEER